MAAPVWSTCLLSTMLYLPTIHSMYTYQQFSCYSIYIAVVLSCCLATLAVCVCVHRCSGVGEEVVIHLRDNGF